MKIELKKFGEILTSRPAGKDAWLTALAYILPNVGQDKIEIDFTGVAVLSPSWADEFFTPLQSKYPGQIIFLPSNNPTVQATLKIIKEQHL